MEEIIVIMFKPLLVCTILTLIHAYFGFHVLARGIIFVDLALAQIAALGATVGFLLGYNLHSQESYFIALCFTFVGALIFTFTRDRKHLIPQEAIIGVIYAISAACSIIMLSLTPDGGEELKSLMVGHLLFVNYSEITAIFIIYFILGILHFFARRPLLLISTNLEEAQKSKLNVYLWDLFFYISLAIVVCSSTKVAGVLLVFSYLIVPAICGSLLANSFKNKFMIASFLGFVTSFLGIICSYQIDLPTGATIVCTFGITLILCYLIKIIKSKIV